MDWLEQVLRDALGLGLESREIGVLEMGLRAVVVYVTTVLMVRLAKKRFMGRATAFDVILGIMLGSIVSRGVTGNAPFGPALAATAVLIAMHWLFSALALRSHGFGLLIKDRDHLLVRDGAVLKEAMDREHITDHDLWEDLRGKGVSAIGQVAEARLERSGTLSVIKRERGGPRVLDVTVADGVQTVRIVLG